MFVNYPPTQSDGYTKLSDYHSKYKQFDNFLNEI